MGTSLLKIFYDYGPRQKEDEIRMQCPFRDKHDSSSDGMNSFFANPAKNVYHCYSCKSSGSLISLLTTKFKVSFVDALELVSLTAIEEKDVYDWDAPPLTNSDMLPTYDAMVDYSKPPKQFLERGFSSRLLRHFKIGSYIDEYGDEVITIPYIFEGRLVDIKNRKSRNFWFSNKFKKEYFVYNYDTQNEKPILVEGETDVYRIYSYGFTQVNGLGGSSFSSAQAELFKHCTDVYVATDRDRAGMVAAELINLRLRNHCNVWFVPYLGDDPEKCSKEDWISAMKEVTDYVVYSSAMYELYSDDEGYYDSIIKDAKKSFAKDF